MSDKTRKKAGKTIRPEKEITRDVMDLFLPKLSNAIAQCTGNLTIDCSRIKTIDAVGTAVFLQARQACRDAKGGVTLTHVNGDIVNMFRTLGLDRCFDMKPKKSRSEKGAAP
ncbi:MAG: STAS domain-containing protein [Desulfobacterales bacterium]|nr:STAS domain-containing protein [Desulfobacterales bacterium]